MRDSKPKIKGLRICNYTHTHKQDKIMGNSKFDKDTHGICPECLKVEMEKIKKYNNERNQNE